MTDLKVLEEKIRSLFKDGIDNLLDDDAHLLKSYVKVRLEKAQDSIMSAVLGMEYRFGTWEVNHARSHTPVLEALREKATQAVKEWMDGKLKLNKKMPDEMLASLQKEYNAIFKRLMTEAVRHKAEEDVQDKLDNLIHAVLGYVPDHERQLYETLKAKYEGFQE